MRLMLLTPGTGHFYCGSCLRDNTLSRALRAQGHEVEVVPLYLPMVLEDGAADDERVHMGGINMYLQQKLGIARHMPEWMTGVLDNPKLLRWASKRGSMTDAPDLGAMTLSMVRGECGRQAKEVEKLVAWAAAQPRPDAFVISNVMLIGVVRRLKQELGSMAIATLQGEAPFLDALDEPFSSQTWDALRERCADVDAFVPVSHDYGETMRERLALDPARIHVVHNGLDLSHLEPRPTPISDRQPKTIGFLARMCRDKGLHTLIAAFTQLAARGSVPGLRLRVAGVQLSEDRALVEQLRAQLREHDCEDAVEWLPNIDRTAKLEFLRSLSVLSVPATYGESFGLYLLEAMAAGVPVVQPRHAAFPEILEATGGGALCEPDDPSSLAAALERVLTDETEAQAYADAGHSAVETRFNASRMATEFAAVCRTTRAS